ncbi:hypothetical protein BN1002_03479 [Bacillus sp. B-jedd]|nr:hypothetical protein BN1002_03479 [Bacillus sp. B-jedd]
MIKEKFAQLFSGFDIVDFVTCKDWGEHTHDDYFKYFNDPDKEIRAGSLLAFACMVGNWYYGSGIVFHCKGEMFTPREPLYVLGDYMSAYLVSKLTIKREFPVLHNYVLYYLEQFDKDVPYEKCFPDEEKEAFNQVRSLIFQGETIPANNFHLPEMQKLLKELSILRKYF